MGFDISGLAATTERGTYFRNNIWWWHPLASYVLEVCADVISPAEQKDWHSNDNQQVSADTAKAISDRLHKLIASGAVKRFEAKYKECMAALPKNTFDAMYPFSEENVRNFAGFCAESGGFEIG